MPFKIHAVSVVPAFASLIIAIYLSIISPTITNPIMKKLLLVVAVGFFFGGVTVALCWMLYWADYGIFDRFRREREPRDAEARIRKGLASFKLGRYGEAMECFDKALKTSPRHPRAWFGKGLALHMSGKPEEAKECFRKAVEIDPRLRKRIESLLGGG